MSKQNYAVCCYTCEHNGQETCKGCNTILNGENEPYENWQLREDLCQKDKQIADLQHKLKVSDKALELCERHHIGFENTTIKEQVEWRETRIKENTNYFKEQAEKEIKGEE